MAIGRGVGPGVGLISLTKRLLWAPVVAASRFETGIRVETRLRRRMADRRGIAVLRSLGRGNILSL